MARLDNLDYEVNGVTTNYEIVPEIAPLFNATTAYAAGDTVIKEGHLYRFNTAHAAGAWIGTDADEITVGEELTSHGADITELKADLTDIETDISTGNLTAGTSEQLLADTGMTDKSPYLFRAMPTGAGDREEPVVVGGSVVWNQLAKELISDNWAKYSGYISSLTFTDGVARLTVVAETVALNYSCRMQHKTFEKNGYNHKNLVVAGITPSTNSYVNLWLYGVTADGTTAGKSIGAVDIPVTTGHKNAVARIINQQFSDVVGVKVAVSLGSDTHPVVQGDYIDIEKVQCFDLTAMFGTAVADYANTLESATAGAGIAWLRKYGFFNSDYYPYTEPTFKHVEGLVSHKMVGVNQWNEEWEVGAYSNSTGAPETASNIIRGKNPIKCLPGTWYYFRTTPGISGGNVYYYDADGNFIRSITAYGNTAFMTTDNCHYIRISMGTSYGTVYKNDVCINFSDPAKNGTYEPYTAYTYPLDTDVVLRGIPKLDANNNLYFDGDVYKADGTVTRKYGIVDLGTLTWTTAASGRHNASPQSMKNVANTVIANMICTNYRVVAGNTVANEDKVVGVLNGTQIQINDSTLNETDAAAFKTAMSGVYLVYELATETTETADPFAPLQLADPYGTEEWVLDADAFPMPVGQETFYPENLRAKIEGLPWNFANLIAPTETTLTATRAYTAGQLFIVDNTLYQATTSIASGGTITPGTNCTATTLAEVISAL